MDMIVFANSPSKARTLLMFCLKLLVPKPSSLSNNSYPMLLPRGKPASAKIIRARPASALDTNRVLPSFSKRYGIFANSKRDTISLASLASSSAYSVCMSTLPILDSTIMVKIKIANATPPNITNFIGPMLRTLSARIFCGLASTSSAMFLYFFCLL